MQQLSGLDASFIYLETPRTPMHIGGVYLFDAAEAPANFSYDRFYSFIESRLKLSRIFRQRLIEVPLGLGHPYWVNDPHFDLAFHLPHMAVPKPGGLKELMMMAGRHFSRPLNRERPLWEMAFVDGLDSFPGLAKGSFAVIGKVHHAAVDGASGAELMGALLDASPEPKDFPGPDTWQPESLPTMGEMIGRSYAHGTRKLFELGRFAFELSTGLAKTWQFRRSHKINPPTMPFTAPESRFNQPVSSKRNFWGVEFPFEKIRNIRTAVPGSTINDVILTVCGGALRDYLIENKALPKKSLVTMAPVSVRSESQRGTMGNQLTSMLVKLETQLKDPLERLQKIHRNANEAKLYSSAIPANRIMEFVPSETAALAARLYTSMNLSEKHRPFFNLVITNVPGPPVPIYLAGAKVAHHIGTAPILDGLGLILVVFSYAGTLSIGISSCQELMPDPDRFGELLKKSFAELRSAAASVVGAEKLAAAVDKRRMAKERSKSSSGKKAVTEATRKIKQKAGSNGSIKLDDKPPARDAMTRLRQALDGLEESIDAINQDHGS